MAEAIARHVEGLVYWANFAAILDDVLGRANFLTTITSAPLCFGGGGGGLSAVEPAEAAGLRLCDIAVRGGGGAWRGPIRQRITEAKKV